MNGPEEALVFPSMTAFSAACVRGDALPMPFAWIRQGYHGVLNDFNAFNAAIVRKSVRKNVWIWKINTRNRRLEL
ncbi:hypothetical protein BET01_13685 [Lacrimispora algidixylanolytica]|uniref:Uncharacterized protein n=1 Tax=Lacrimispora algidixylanolytica TaxID=94868 RepID=A0A419T837_9FIRM|nr:hypothetical protein BET01_13685 [Lacrimispora algidixylanolytica]